jgi:CMP-N,N'-diacetyllegionaminic acid synthase
MRGGSKGLKNKNLSRMNNKYLMWYTIHTAKKSKIFEDVVVSSDNSSILKIAKTLGIKNFIHRKKTLSKSKTSKILVIRDCLKKMEINKKKKYDLVFDLDVTSPLRIIDDIKKAKKTFIKNKYDILVSGTEARSNPYFNAVKKTKNGVMPVLSLQKKITCRQDAPKVYDLNASIYIWKRNVLLKKDNLWGRKTGLYVMPFERSWDIDTKTDFQIVSFFMENN